MEANCHGCSSHAPWSIEEEPGAHWPGHCPPRGELGPEADPRMGLGRVHIVTSDLSDPPIPRIASMPSSRSPSLDILLGYQWPCSKVGTKASGYIAIAYYDDPGLIAYQRMDSQPGRLEVAVRRRRDIETPPWSRFLLCGVLIGLRYLTSACAGSSKAGLVLR